MGRAFEYRRAAKEKRWDKMSKIFPKLAKTITLAAKEGGIDPDMNPRLRTAIQNAKAQNMPKDNIDAAIKRSLGKEADAYTEINYEGKGPHGVLVYVECATDNTTRTVANVKSYFNKVGGGLVPSGSLEFMFNRKAVFEFDKTGDMDIEEMELELVQMVRTKVGPVASFKKVAIVQRLPKTRSGKILRRIMRHIADGKPFNPPSTIEDMTVLPELEDLMKEKHIGQGAE